MTTLKSLIPNLMVKDMSETITFYTKVLGFEIILAYPKEGNYEWAYLRKGDANLMFQASKTLKAEFPELNTYNEGGALTLFIQMENVKDLYESIVDKSSIIRPYSVTSYNGANEFVLKDLNGFILHFSDINFSNFTKA